jgi:hypothetical protein
MSRIIASNTSCRDSTAFSTGSSRLVAVASDVFVSSP